MRKRLDSECKKSWKCAAKGQNGTCWDKAGIIGWKITKWVSVRGLDVSHKIHVKNPDFLVVHC